MAFVASSSVSLLCLVIAISASFHLNECHAGSNPAYPCSPPHASYGFCNKFLPLEQRVADIVSRLSLEEKVLQLITSAAGIPRLGIPPYQWWSEALHGVSNSGFGVTFSKSIPAAVSFPQVILSAASFNPSLWKAMGQVVSTEARALHNEGHAYLTYWSPNINIFRDPRWGRGQETPGEDPLLASQYAVNYVRGLQDVQDGTSSDALKVAACCKHYTAYDLDNWNGITRFNFNAEVTPQDFEDTYQPPFKSCIVEGNAACVMCSYNRVNGRPSCVDKDLLNGIVREKWNLHGYIVSDCDAIEVLYDDVHYTSTPEDAVADSIIAGLDLNCGVFLANFTARAVAKGKLSESKVDESLTHSYTVLMRLGYFNGNPTTQQPFGMLGAFDVCSTNHMDLALEAARQSIVLLKNDVTNQISLPFSRSSIHTIAVIGPHANATSAMLGNYFGIPCRYVTPLQGLATYGAKVIHAPGCADVACESSDHFEKAVNAAIEADYVILIMGLDQSQEQESLDRTSLKLPGQQENLIMRIASSVHKSNIVLVIMSGGPLDIEFAKNLKQIPSILWVGYPGEAGGKAIAEIIYGDYNPAGRLPMSWYPESYTKVAMTDMHMRPNVNTGYPGRTYRFYTGNTIYDFGHGLSYTSFSQSISSSTPSHVFLSQHMLSDNFNHDVNVHVEHLKCDELNFSMIVRIQNVGAMMGDHVIMLIWKPSSDIVDKGVPRKQLLFFHRAHALSPNEEREISVELNVCTHLSYVDANADKLVRIGKHIITVEDYEHEIYIHS